MARTVGRVDATAKSRTSGRRISKKVPSTVTENVVYEIAGVRYGTARATKDGAYITTKATWHVARVTDRRDTKLGQEYKVFWLNRSRQRRKYYVFSWEPRKVLLEDKFEEEVAFVDRWKAAKDVV